MRLTNPMMTCLEDRSLLPGFSLMEVLIVLVVIGILVALAIPGYVQVRNSAREAEVKSNLHTVQVAVEDFAVANEGETPDYLIGGSEGEPEDRASDPLLRNGYLGSYPENPFISEERQIVQMQREAADPLRPGTSEGKLQGHRFGGGTLMGNVAGGHRYRDSHRQYLVRTEAGPEELSSYDNFCYLPVPECEVSPVEFVPGELAYQPGYVLAAFGGPGRRTGEEELPPVEELDCSEQGTGRERGICALRRTFPEFRGQGLIITTGPGR